MGQIVGVLVDSSVWVNHLRRTDVVLQRLLADVRVLCHPAVIGELALGSIRDRRSTLGLLGDLPRAAVADDKEVLAFIERRNLAGRGVGLVDAQLLAAAALTPGSRLWTADKRLKSAATNLELAFDPAT